jgi:hypothetical protein
MAATKPRTMHASASIDPGAGKPFLDASEAIDWKPLPIALRPCVVYIHRVALRVVGAADTHGGRILVAVIALMSSAGCGLVLGISDVPGVDRRDASRDQASPDTSSDRAHTGERDSGSRDATRDTTAARDAAAEAEAEAAVCVPVSTPEAGLPDGPCPGPSDASEAGACVPVAVSPSALTWIPPVPRKKVCTTKDIQSLFSPVELNDTCFKCLVSYAGTGLTNFGATVNFPQVTYEIFGIPNFAGCIATLEPCNLPCAKAVEAADLCINEACLGGGCPDTQQAFDSLQACVDQAGQSCPCAAYLEAANTCAAEIAARGSPAVLCFGNGGSGSVAYMTQVEAIGELLCGGLDAGPDAL